MHQKRKISLVLALLGMLFCPNSFASPKKSNKTQKIFFRTSLIKDLLDNFLPEPERLSWSHFNNEKSDPKIDELINISLNQPSKIA